MVNRKFNISILFILITIVITSGCSTVETRKEWSDLSRRIKLQENMQLVWEKTENDEARVKNLVDNALKGGLTWQEAVTVALLNNRILQSTFEEIGVSGRQRILQDAGFGLNFRQ